MPRSAGQPNPEARNPSGAGDRLRRGECDRETLRSVPSWGLSVLLHALVLLILAAHDPVVAPGPPGGDVRRRDRCTPSSARSPHSSMRTRPGDPFTLTELARSAVDRRWTADPQLKLVGQPRDPLDDPVCAGPGRPDAPAGREECDDPRGPHSPSSAMNVTAPFSGRQGDDPGKLVRREGGTAIPRRRWRTASTGSSATSAADGSWSLNYHEQCQATRLPRAARDGVGHRRDGPGPAAAPGGRLHPHREEPLSGRTSARGSTGWSITSRPTATCSSAAPGMAYLYSHAIATMALCEAYGLSRRPPPASARRKRAIEFIVDVAGPGHRRLAVLPRPGRGHLGLRLADVRAPQRPAGAGIAIPANVLKGCQRYLDLAGDRRARSPTPISPAGRPRPS